MSVTSCGKTVKTAGLTDVVSRWGQGGLTGTVWLGRARKIQDGQTVLVTGATGSGKSYLACAFGHQVCRLGISTRYYRVSRLIDELTLARGDGSYPKLIQRLARTWLLILDDWGLASLSGQGRHDLLEAAMDLRSSRVIRMLRNRCSACRNW